MARPLPAYVPKPGFEEAFLRTGGVRDMLDEVTEQVAEEARRLAPFDWFRKGIESEVGTEDGQLIGRVNANDWRSHFWEFGTIKHDARPALRPALDRIIR